MNKTDLIEKIKNGSRINCEEALTLYQFDWHELAPLANLRRKIIHPNNQIGYIKDRIINYSNICEAKCLFCAFHASAGIVPPYELDYDMVLEKVEELVRNNGTQVMLQGGIAPRKGLSWYLELISRVKNRFPHIVLHSFSPAEIIALARFENITVSDLLAQFKEAGLDSVPGASDLLSDRIRQRVSPAKPSVAEYSDFMRALARAGFKSSATMTFGMGEDLSDRINHLDVVRSLQDELGIIRAFIPWSFVPERTLLKNIYATGGLEYLKQVAISRIYLDNVPNLQAGWLTEGKRLAQLALLGGANDMGGVLLEELVVKAAGTSNVITESDMISLIKEFCYIPVQRDSNYQVLKIHV